MSSAPPLNMSKNLIPLAKNPATITARLIPDDQNSAWNDLGQIPQPVRGFVLHRQLGSNWGTDKWFRDDPSTGRKAGGLTTYGQNSKSDAPGSVLYWNDPTGTPHDVRMVRDANGNWQYPASGGQIHHVHDNRWGWASGPVDSPYGDGALFVKLYGANAVNGCVSWEIDGFYNDPWYDAAVEIAAQACAHYAHNYGITYLDFPTIKRELGRSFVMWHQELTIGTGKICPGPVVMNRTSAFIERVRAILKAYQLTTKPIDPAKPPAIPPPIKYTASVLPDWWPDSLASARPSDGKHLGSTAYVIRRNFRALDGTVRRSAPSTDAKASGPNVATGHKIGAERIWIDPKTKRQWIIEDAGHWLLASKFTPRATIVPRTVED